MKYVIIDWQKRRIETHFRGAIFIRRFDHMLAANRDRVAAEIRKLIEQGYSQKRVNPFVWEYSKGSMAI